MTTDKQKAANQTNAKKSTGPQSKAGKMVSRRNALTHGLTGEIIFHPGESPEAYRKLRREYHEEFKPYGPYQTELVERLVSIDWRLRRVLNWKPFSSVHQGIAMIWILFRARSALMKHLREGSVRLLIMTTWRNSAVMSGG